MKLLIYDSGLFSHFAEAMVRHFDEVMYYADWKAMMPKGSKMHVGTGLPGVRRVFDFFDAVDEADLIMFTDVGTGDLQKYLRSKGKLVWGPGHGEQLELDREGLKRLMAKLDMPSPRFETVVGVKALRAFLADKEDLFLKVSRLRGDWETMHHETAVITNNVLDELVGDLGPGQNEMQFLCEWLIKDATEIGYDGWCIDGQFPKTNVLQGIEIKDCGYAGAIMKGYDELPEQIRYVNAKLAPVFQWYGYRGFFSSEVRIPADGQAYFIDPCCRCGSPPSQLFQEMYSNWQAILVGGAGGTVVEPIPVKPYGVMAVICSESAGAGKWCPMEYPAESNQWVKLRHQVQRGDVHWVAPQEVNFPQVGYIVGIGDNLLHAIKNVCSVAETIRGDVHINLGAMSKAITEIQESGITFGRKPLPSMNQVRKAVQ